MPGALAIVLIGYAEALAAAKAAATEGDADIDPNQELIAHGPATILSGLFGGFLAVGSLSKTSLAMAAGARSQLANFVAALLCFLTMVLLTPLFRRMLHPTLAAIVIAAMLHLSKPAYLRELLAQTRREFAIAMIVVAAELTQGVLQGIALGVMLSLLLVIYRTSHPSGAVLGQVPGTEAYRDVERHPEAVTFPPGRSDHACLPGRRCRDSPACRGWYVSRAGRSWHHRVARPRPPRSEAPCSCPDRPRVSGNEGWCASQPDAGHRRPATPAKS
jgi:MFS superfamily sulfate permease-like transporter